MSKKTLPGATLLAPLPAVMVSVGDSDNANVITVAWTGIVCSQPPKLYVSVRHDRFSYDILKRCGELQAKSCLPPVITVVFVAAETLTSLPKWALPRSVATLLPRR